MQSNKTRASKKRFFFQRFMISEVKNLSLDRSRIEIVEVVTSSSNRVSSSTMVMLSTVLLSSAVSMLQNFFTAVIYE